MHDLKKLRLLAFVFLLGTHSVCHAQSRLDEAPIRYTETKGKNRVTALIEKVESGQLELVYEDGYGYLRSILRELQVPISSQALVFSKTSLQTGRIAPANPRAIFFGDDVYVGWVRGSSLLEVSVADPNLGAVYYTIQMTPRRPYMRRENFRCLGCHEKTVDHGKIPVHTIQSVMARDSGKINLLLDSFVTDHTSPISERWGGWYVTGHSGAMKHRGNAFLEGEELISIGESTAETLGSQFDLSGWPIASSDIVALMVLEHQTEMHNRLTDANYAVRRARFSANDSPGQLANLEMVVDRSAKLVVDHLLFVDEAKLDEEIQGSNSFAEDFVAKGPLTSDGKSLRQFDLRKRLFRFPCSYTIYSPAFSALDERLKGKVYERLLRVLTGQDESKEYEHLSSDDRASVLEILRQTMDALPASWVNTETR